MDKEPITVNGLQNLKELEDLKMFKGQKLLISWSKISWRSKENAEYHAAKEQQALIESR